MMMSLIIVSTTAGLGATQADTSLASTAQQTQSNNTTVQHERPSEASESGDTQRVSQWIERRLTTQLQGSMVNISRGQYDQARNVLGEEYSSRLEQYVSVAGNGSNSRANETYQSARQTQRTYLNASQEYQETYDRYEQARREGNTTAAREAARKLERLSQRVGRLNASLQDDYTELQNQTGTDTGNTRLVLENTTTNISTQQATVRSQTFTETRLTAGTNESAVAFDDPSTISGQIQLANGTALGNSSGRIAVGNRSYQIRTDDEGRFSVTYRPVSLLMNATSVQVQFLPPNTSAYLGASAGVPVNLTQVSPRIEIVKSRATGGYGDTLTTTAVVTVGGEPVPSLPIRGHLGNTVVTGRTTDSGHVTLSPQVPTPLSPGEHSLRVAHDRSARAVGPNATATTVTITETATALTLNTTTDRPIRIHGRLRTADRGTGIGAQRIHLRFGDTNRSVETNETGWFRLRLSNISSTDSDGNLSVTARFDGSGTNLQDSRAETTVILDSAGDAGESQPPLVLAGLVLGVLVITGVVGWSQRQGSREVTNGSDAVSETTATTTSPDVSREWLERARDALSTGDNERAVASAYGAIRHKLERDASLPTTLTHREFVGASEAALDETDSGALWTVAMAYERAAFEGSIDSTAAEEAVDAAATLLPDAGKSKA